MRNVADNRNVMPAAPPLRAAAGNMVARSWDVQNGGSAFARAISVYRLPEGLPGAPDRWR